jgi:hypothetical protein
MLRELNVSLCPCVCMCVWVLGAGFASVRTRMWVTDTIGSVYSSAGASDEAHSRASEPAPPTAAGSGGQATTVEGVFPSRWSLHLALLASHVHDLNLD